MSPTLVISVNGEPVGHLRDENGYWTFQYAPAWLSNPLRFPIAPSFPLSAEKVADDATTRRVAWFFDNLLPEEAARETLAKDAAVQIDDAWGLLEYYGAESAGALTLLPEGADVAPAGLEPLPDAELQARIDLMPQRSLSADSPKRMSLAGAQHKLAVTLKAGSLFEPTGAECSTHILKPDSKTAGYPHTSINEHFCMRLAAELKLSVPATEVRYVPWPIYLVERFDRVSRAGQLMRSHALDALQLLSLDRRLKYTKANAATLRACVAHCGAVLQTKQAIFAWVVLNVLVGNADAHMKNISFIADAAGLRLAPFYDLVSTVVYATPQYDPTGPYWPNVGLSMPIGGATKYAEIGKNDLLQFADELELKPKPASRILQELASRVEPKAAALLAELLPKALPGERRLLNLIHQLPVREMSQRLL